MPDLVFGRKMPEIPWLKIMDHSDDEPIEIDPEFIFFLEEMEHK